MKIKQIQIHTGAYEKVLEFYRDVLLFEIVEVKGDEEFHISAGSSQIKISRAIGNPIYHFAFNIPSNKIEEAYEWLRQKTSLLWLEDSKSYIANFVNWHAKSVYFLDPAGNIVEFIARFDLNDEVEEAFSPAQLRCVSEIGLVFPKTSFDEGIKKLFSAYPLQYFDKQPPLEHFRAIGDDNGLFIAVPENRNWYPTSDTASAIHPLSVQFDLEGKEYFLSVSAGH